jgi:heterodisulfide reductase subunit C
VCILGGTITEIWLSPGAHCIFLSEIKRESKDMTTAEMPRTIIPDARLRKEVEETSGQTVSACFQCEKCTNGCPVTFAADIMPHEVIHLVQLGQADKVLQSDMIWVCASCETCTTRCPNGIDIAHVMDALRQISQRKGMKASQPSIPRFHSAFLSSIKRHGRVHETEMVITYTLKDKGIPGLLKYATMGLDMFRKGKVKPMPSRIRAVGSVKNMFRKAEGRE